jgi:hypothetical protein
MTIKEIVTEYLEHAGFDGLCYPDGECSCLLGDLMPCAPEGYVCDCQPGYKVPCDPETCEFGGECGWHVTLSKP